MKNSIKVLFAVSIMLFAMSFSTFGATNNETQSKRNVTKIQTQNNSDKGLKNTQITNLNLAQLKQAQLNYNLLKAKCLKLLNSLDDDLSNACKLALAAYTLAQAGALAACASGSIVACALATGAVLLAIEAVRQTCAGGIQLEETNAINRKFRKSRTNSFQFGT